MLLRATLLQAFFSVRSERLLMEQIDYNLLFRWFVGLPMDGAVWHPTVFTHNRDRLLEKEQRSNETHASTIPTRGSTASPTAAAAGCASWGMS